jgi:hypothetical protein
MQHAAPTYVRGPGVRLGIILKRRVEMLRGCAVSECSKLQGVINILNILWVDWVKKG